VPKKRYAAALMALALLSLASSSCQRIFTSSLAPFLARDGYTIPSNLSVADAAYLLSQSQGDPDLAAALVTPLYNAASAATPGTAAYDEAATLLAQAVTDASGIGPAITTLAVFATIASPTAEEIAEATDAVLAVSLNAAEINALSLILANPPSDYTPAMAYTAAAALAAQALSDIGVTDINGLTGPQEIALAGNLEYQLALDFINLASTTLGGDGGLGDQLGQYLDELTP
jgi:hypothetical protein